MNPRDQGRHPAHVEVPAAHAAPACQTLDHVALDRRLPEAFVGGIDGEFPGFFRNPHIRMREDEFTETPVQGESVHAPAHGEHQHGRRPVDCISRAQLLRSRLQKVRPGGQRSAVGGLEDRENAPHRRIDVDVAGAVQRIEGQ